MEHVSSPEELLALMNDRIKYGFLDKEGQVIEAGQPELQTKFTQEYRLQSPEELLESGHGVCWDTVELERRWFTEHGFSPKTYFVMYAKEGGTDLPTHTFLAYEQKERWYWFEQAFADQRGLHEYSSLDELLQDVLDKHHAYAMKHRGAQPSDKDQLRFSEYDFPEVGSRPDEFVRQILQQHPELLT